MNYINIKLYYDAEHNLFTYNNVCKTPMIYKSSNNAYKLFVVCPDYDENNGSMYANFQRADGTQNSVPLAMNYEGIESVLQNDGTRENWRVYSCIIPDEILEVANLRTQNTLLITPSFHIAVSGEPEQVFNFQPYNAYCRYSISNNIVEVDDATVEMIINYINQGLALKIDKFDGIMRLSQYADNSGENPVFSNLRVDSLYICDLLLNSNDYLPMSIYRATSTTALELWNGGVLCLPYLLEANVPQNTMVFLTDEYEDSNNITYQKYCLYVNNATFEEDPVWQQITYNKGDIDILINNLDTNKINKVDGLMRISNYTYDSENHRYEGLRNGCLYLVDRVDNDTFHFGDIIVADNNESMKAKLFYRAIRSVDELPLTSVPDEIVFLETEQCFYAGVDDEEEPWVKVSYTKSEIDNLLLPITNAISDYATRIGTLEGKVNTLETITIPSLSSRIGDLETDNTSNKSRITALENNKLNKDFSGLGTKNEIADNDIFVIKTNGGQTLTIPASAIKQASEHYLGNYNSVEALEEAYPTARAGDYAYVEIDTSGDTVLIMYIWDNVDSEWQETSSTNYVDTATFQAFQSSLANGTFVVNKSDKVGYNGGFDTIENVLANEKESTPTASSTKLITSGGVYDALLDKEDKLTVYKAPTFRVSLGGVYLLTTGRTHTGQGTVVTNLYNAITNSLNFTTVSGDNIYLPFEVYNFRYSNSSASRDNTMTVKVKNVDSNGYNLIGYDFKNATIVYINGIKENETTFTTSYATIQSLFDTDTNTWRAVYLGGSRMMGNGITTPDLDFVAGDNIGIRYDTGGHFTFRVKSDNATQGQVLTADGSGSATWEDATGVANNPTTLVVNIPTTNSSSSPLVIDDFESGFYQFTYGSGNTTDSRTTYLSLNNVVAGLLNFPYNSSTEKIANVLIQFNKDKTECYIEYRIYKQDFYFDGENGKQRTIARSYKFENNSWSVLKETVISTILAGYSTGQETSYDTRMATMEAINTAFGANDPRYIWFDSFGETKTLSNFDILVKTPILVNCVYGNINSMCFYCGEDETNQYYRTLDENAYPQRFLVTLNKTTKAATLSGDYTSFGGYYFTTTWRNNSSASTVIQRIKNAMRTIVQSNEDIYLPFKIFNFKLENNNASRNNVMTARMVKIGKRDESDGYNSYLFEGYDEQENHYYFSFSADASNPSYLWFRYDPKPNLSDYQPLIDSTHKISSDLVDDASANNKFVTSSEKTQITTNATNITSLQTNKQNALTTSSVSDGTINKVIGFDSNGDLVKATPSSVPTVTIGVGQVISASPFEVQLTQAQYDIFDNNKQVLIDLSSVGQSSVVWTFFNEDSSYIKFGFVDYSNENLYLQIQINKSTLVAEHVSNYKEILPSTIGTGASADEGKILAMDSSGWGTLTKNLPVLTTAPSADNSEGGIIIVVLSSEPATKYNGYLYIITSSNS